MSGASNVLPSEFAYFLRIMSRTSSTKSSSRICTSVADALGRFTQIFRCNMAAIFGTLGVKWLYNPAVGKTLSLAVVGGISGRSALVGTSMSVLTILALAPLRMLCWRAWVFGSAGRCKSRRELVGEAAQMRPGWAAERSVVRSWVEETRVSSPDAGRLWEL